MKLALTNLVWLHYRALQFEGQVKIHSSFQFLWYYQFILKETKEWNRNIKFWGIWFNATFESRVTLLTQPHPLALATTAT